MPIITHRFECALPEAADVTKIRTSNWNDTHEIENVPYLVSTDYVFDAITPGVALTGGISNTITLTPVPKGINGSNLNHYLYISNGTGTDESVLITGGTAVSEATSGTITFTPANSHSGAWDIRSATAGIQEAIYFGNGNNVKIRLPYGDHHIHAAIRINGGGVAITGEGTMSSRILYLGPSTSANIIELVAASFNQFNSLKNFAIETTGLTMTAGYALYCYNQGYLCIENVFSANTYHGAYYEGIVVAHIVEPMHIYLAAGAGIGLTIKDSATHVINDLIIDHFFTNNPLPILAGIEIFSCGYVSLFRPSCLTCERGIQLVPGVGQTIASLDVILGYFDHCTDIGILLDAAGDGNIVRTSFYNCWAGSTTGQGVYINKSGTGTYLGIYFIQCKIYDNTLHGFLITGGDDINIINCTITGNSASPSAIGANSGITVTGNVTGLKVKNCRIGPADGFTDRQGYGIFVDGAVTANDLVISDNDVTGNTVGSIGDGSAGAVKVIKDNKGVTEIAFSTGATAVLSLGFSGHEKLEVSGTGTVTSMTPAWKGRRVRLTPTNAAGITIGSSATIPKAKVLTQYETYTLEYNGTVWY